MGSPDKGYVKAHIEAGEFDAAAYSFFGEMAPLDEGLGGALEDGLEAPPEELPAEEGALDEDEDLPIEDLLGSDEDEDLSLAALLRRRMQEEEGEGGSSSAQASAAAAQQQQQPLMPPMPPQPQMLGSLGQQQQQHAPSAPAEQQLHQHQQRDYAAASAAAQQQRDYAAAAAQQQQQRDYAAAAAQQQQQQRDYAAAAAQQQQQQQRDYVAASAAAAAAAAAPELHLPDAAALDAVVPAPGSTPMRGKITAQTTPSNVLTAEELEARMLRSAEQAAATPPAAAESRGSALLSMLKGGAGGTPADQQQRHASPMQHHLQDPSLAAAQQQMQQMLLGGPMSSTPMLPPGPQQGMGGPQMFPPHTPPPPHLMQQQQPPGPGMLPPHPGMMRPPGGPIPPPEVLAQMQQQQRPPPHMLPPPGQQQQPPFMAGQPGGPGPMGPMGPLPQMHPGGMIGDPPLPFQQGGMGPAAPFPGAPMGMPPPHMGGPGMPPPQGMGPPQGMPYAGPFGPRGPPGGPMQLPMQQMPPGGQQQQQQQPGAGLMRRPPQMRPQGPQAFLQQQQGAPPMPGQLMPPQGPPQPFPGGTPPLGGPKQPGMPSPGFSGLPAGTPQQQQQRHGSPAGMHGGASPHMPHPQQQQQQGGPHLPLWAEPGAPSGPRPPMQQQEPQQQQPAFGGEYLPTATAAPADAVRVVSPAALVHRLRSGGSTWMAADDINYILRIQHMATHSGVPYVEDFYFQAFCNKYFGARNAVIFAPQQLRELGSELRLNLEPLYADLAGLGRVVLSNIRTPKMLMDVGGGSSSNSKEQQQQQDGAGEGDGAAAEAAKARPLEQEPMLAARIMVEDCMLLLCDVEDIDRMFAATAAAGAAHAAGVALGPHALQPMSPALAQGLLQRRAALLGGIAASFRLPDAPTLAATGSDTGAAAAAGAAAAGDRVFVRILALPKGRSLVTKTLKLMFTPPPAAAGSGPKGGKAAGGVNGSSTGDVDSSSSSSSSMGLDVIWALLRNAQLAFGPPLVGSVGEAEKRLTDATIALAAIASEMVKRLQRPQEAVACLAAAIAGLSAPVVTAGSAAADTSNGTSACQLLPLYPAGRVPASASPEWLGSILGALLLRASELGLGSFAAAAAALPLKGLGDGAPDEAELQEQQQQAEANGVPADVSAEWQALLAQFVQLVQLHLWQLVQATRGAAAEVAAAAAAGPGSSEVLLASVPKMACVPLMRVLMAHCSEEQQEQLKGYLSEVGR